MLLFLPIGLGALFAFIDRWECRPIEMLSFYLERRIIAPDDVAAAARARVLNLPLVHAASALARYQIANIICCLYMWKIGGLDSSGALRLGLYAGLGLAIFPVFSFFITEQFLYPIRRILAEKTKGFRLTDHSVIVVNTKTRLVAIFLAVVITPLLILGTIVYHNIDTEIRAFLVGSSVAREMVSHISFVIVIVTAGALSLAFGIGMLLSRSIATPLSHMVKVIKEVERGNLKARSNLISNDEIGELAQSFDRMAGELERNRDELEDLNQNLERRVEEKTRNLTKAYERLQISNKNLAIVNKELEEANKKLKELDRLKSDFISIVSHELRTPLTSIKAFAELILMKPQMPDERRCRLLTIINSETDRLTRLINDMLDLTKIEFGKMSWHIFRLSIEDVIHASISGIQPLIDAKGLHISANIEPYIPQIKGDKDRLIQVMTNLISNAIKFTPQGGSIKINARLERTQRPQRSWWKYRIPGLAYQKKISTVFSKSSGA